MFPLSFFVSGPFFLNSRSRCLRIAATPGSETVMFQGALSGEDPKVFAVSGGSRVLLVFQEWTFSGEDLRHRWLPRRWTPFELVPKMAPSAYFGQGGCC